MDRGFLNGFSRRIQRSSSAAALIDIWLRKGTTAGRRKVYSEHYHARFEYSEPGRRVIFNLLERVYVHEHTSRRRMYLVVAAGTSVESHEEKRRLQALHWISGIKFCQKAP